MVKTGSNLDKYTLHEMIGGGGFATVFRATDTTLEREAAVKVLKDEFLNKAETRERFTQEARKASGLSQGIRSAWRQTARRWAIRRLNSALFRKV